MGGFPVVPRLVSSIVSSIVFVAAACADACVAAGCCLLEEEMRFVEDWGRVGYNSTGVERDNDEEQ